MKIRIGTIVPALLLFAISAFCSEALTQQGSEFDHVVDKIAAKEAENAKTYQKYSPLVETYVQMMSDRKMLGPDSDRYFLGRAEFTKRVVEEEYLPAERAKVNLLNRLLRRIPELIPHKEHTEWIPAGFAQMAIVDSNGLNRQRYNFRFIRRQFLGEVRCLVFDVMPKPTKAHGSFAGRIYVEDQDFNIVRFQGLFEHPKDNGSAYFHFDSWRVNVADGRWVPAYIYAEEPDVTIDGRKVALKSQTRLWGYAATFYRNYPSSSNSRDTFTSVYVDSKDSVNDQSPDAGALSPLGSEQRWQDEAERNLIEKLEEVGILAPPSPVDKMLEQVVNNLIITNNLQLAADVQCRVLVTAPMESFTIGNTIVISRGLLDVLPDEASLAAVLTQELAHIVLGHVVDTKYAFNDRLFFADSQTLQQLSLMHSAAEQKEAADKTVELLSNSPYKDKLATVGLFLKQLDKSKSSLPNLIQARIGNALICDTKIGLATTKDQAPELQPLDLKQIAALPLGTRIDVDPWTNLVVMTKAEGAIAVTPRDKMPFQIAPFYPFITRVGQGKGREPAKSTDTLTPSQLEQPVSEQPVHSEQPEQSLVPGGD
jgi:hypothetical protein